MSSSSIDIEDQQPLTTEKYSARDTKRTIGFLSIVLVVIGVALGVCVFLLAKSIVDLHDSVNSINSQLAESNTVGTKPKNIIWFVTDGMGPAQLTLARNVLRHRTGVSNLKLQADNILVGTISTSSSNSLITDSAAGATAWACGVKCANNRVGVNSVEAAVGSVLEAAQLAGMATGLVATKSITDATPAAFSAHTVNRGNEELIALQQSQSGIELLLGGGSRFYTQRSDGRNLFTEMENAGYHILTTNLLRQGQTPSPVIGLFSTADMAYEIDRNNSAEPSLSEMAQAALDILSSSKAGLDNGFFVMIEASQIDIACHDNDAGTYLEELYQWDKAMEIAKAFQAKHPDTLIISLSDHETGGLTLSGGAHVQYNTTISAREGSLTQPSNGPQHETKASNFSFSTWLPVYGVHDLEMKYSYMVDTWDTSISSLRRVASTLVTRYLASQPVNASGEIMAKLGINITAAEQTYIDQALAYQQWLSVTPTAGASKSDKYYASPLLYALGHIMATRAGVTFTTKGHSGVDVFLYASGPGASSFAGSHENTDVTGLVTKLMNWNLAMVTQNLLEKGVDVGTCPYLSTDPDRC